MKTLAFVTLAVALCFGGIGCAAKGSIKTGQNTGVGAAVRVGYTSAPAAQK